MLKRLGDGFDRHLRRPDDGLWRCDLQDGGEDVQRLAETAKGSR